MNFRPAPVASALLLLSVYTVPAGAAGADTASPLDALTGQMLSSVDGSTITLQPTEDGLSRVLVAPNGSVRRTHFSFLGPQLGTVSGGRDDGTLLGVFREANDAIDVQYADGHNEHIGATAGGGLAMTVSQADGQSRCMAWYPKGHVFSEAQRRAALAEYAKRLGVSLGGPKDAAAQPQTCAEPATRSATADGHVSQDVPSLAQTAANAAKAAGAPAIHAAGEAAAKSILVRTSAVHAIDANAGLGGTPADAGAQMAAANPDSPAASACLSVDSDGHNWGFRNRCGYPVQFVYCLKDGGDPLTACANGSVSGSVEAKAFAALSADKTLSETDADHDFRWVACRGGAGEVVPRLDRTSPPAGRCIRARAS